MWELLLFNFLSALYEPFQQRALWTVPTDGDCDGHGSLLTSGRLHSSAAGGHNSNQLGKLTWAEVKLLQRAQHTDWGTVSSVHTDSCVREREA